MDRIRYICNGCRYKFNRNFKPELCPFCGRKSIAVYIFKGAQDVLDEVINRKQ